MQVMKSPLPIGQACAAVLVLALAGCVNDPDEKAPSCPVALTRPDADRLASYDGRGTDLTNLVLGVKIADVKGACRGQLGHRMMTAHAHVVLDVTRGPASQSRDADIAYNLAVVKQGQLLEKKHYTQHVTFPPNVDNVEVAGDEIQFDFPTRRGLNGPDYSIFFVLDLTPEELAANQRALAQH